MRRQKQMQTMTQMMQTLVVDDDDGVRFFLSELLQQGDHAVTTAANGEEALRLLRDTAFDLIVLDLHLGGRVDGMRVLEAVKWQWPETAVVIITAYGTLDSALSAIREGVDGYLLKPVEAGEIRQVIREIQNRRRQIYQNYDSAALEEGAAAPDKLQWKALLLDQATRQVTFQGQPVDLTKREFDLLAYFMQHLHQVLSPSQLVKVIHGYESEDVDEARNLIKWYIHQLRHKIEPDPGRPQYIVNVRGVGYIFGGRPSPGEKK
jgi:two-component system alkaline phosphatase synthesis response regulator PhoP